MNALLDTATVEDIVDELMRRDVQFVLLVDRMTGSQANSFVNSYVVKDDPNRLVGALERLKFKLMSEADGVDELSSENED